MDKKAMMESMAREASARGSFNGTWLYAEHGHIVSKGAFGWRDAENTLPMEEDTIFEMASITKYYDCGEAAVLSIQAGCDIVLMPKSIAEAFDSILKAVQNGTLSEERINESVLRILTLKYELGIIQ